MMKKAALLVLWAFLLGGGLVQASVIDAPHNESNGISCSSCHTYSMWWQYSPATQSANPSYNAIVNTVCMTCHDSSGPAPAVAGHSGAAMESNTYHGGLWEEGCTVCHNPHEQNQIAWTQENVNPYLVTGTITSVITNSPAVGQTTISFSEKTNNPALSIWPESIWSDKSAGYPGRGLILVHNKTLAFNTFSVASATPTQIVVKGTINPGDINTSTCPQAPNCSNANTFGLLYGQFIRKTIATPSSGNRSVKFLDPKGGFTDGNTPPTGVCQVCHTETHYWDTNGGNATHNIGTNCTTCHPHLDGFKPQFPSHDTFVQAQAQCIVCHNQPDLVLGTHKGICDHCHTIPPALANPTDHPLAIAITQGDCFTCHGSTFSHPNAEHLKVTADASCSTCHDTSNIINTTHKANCLGCHQSTHPAVINAIATKAGGSCLTCHNGTTDGAFSHGTTPATVAPQHNNFVASVSCASCHDIDTAEKRISRHPACTTCHGYAGTKLDPTVVATAIATGKGVSGTEVNCQTCHTASHNTATDHNHRQALASCASCHAASTQAAIDTLHKQDCGTCHGYAGTKLDATTVANAINTGKGVNGTDVNCQTCHVAGHNTATDHNHRIALASCASCHAVSTQTAIDTLHKQDCGTCHGYAGTKLDATTVANAINTGKGVSGSDINCQTCHTAGHNTTTDHNHRTTVASCAVCHVVDTAIQFDAAHNMNCGTCHGYTGTKLDPTVVANAINTGKGINGTDVNCQTCHTTGHIVIADKLVIHNLVNDGCRRCHTPTNTDPAHNNLKGTALCTGCHTASTFNAIWSTHKSDCLKCHLSSRPEVIAAISAGIPDPGTVADCTTCHGPTLHDSTVAHNHRKVVTSCATCHAVGSADAVDTLHQACTTCHGYAGTKLNPLVVANAINTGKGILGADVNCQTCHTASHDTETDHNHRQVSSGCASCHAVSTQTAIDTLHKQACGTCHGYNGTKLNPTTVANAITTGKGPNGTDVDCQTCHTAGHNTDTDHNHRQVTASCATCHAVSSQSAIDTLHKQACGTCHGYNGTKLSPTTVANAITTGKGPNGTDVNCQTCHTAGHNTTVDHNHRKTVSSCAVCHMVDTASEVDIAHKNNCGTCHGYNGTKLNPTVVANAITSGKGANGTDVNCQTCHTAGHLIFTSRLAIHNLVNDGCRDCHTPTNEDPAHNNLTGAPSCTGCHTATPFTNIWATHKNDCLKCHLSSRPEVIAAIIAGLTDTGAVADCITCHGPTLHDSVLAHNHRQVTASCAACHTVGTTAAVDTLHKACTTCHGYAGTKLDPIVVANAITTGKGATGTDVNCQTCHTAGHNTDTDHNHRKVTASCASCHAVSTQTAIDTLHKACTTCHGYSGTKLNPTTVANAITTGKGATGTDINCQTCHAAGHNTDTDHNHRKVTASCASCHAVSTQAAIDTLHKACTTCHGYSGTKLNPTTVANAITTGKGATGTDVNCQTCHGTDVKTAHHATAWATQGKCYNCHRRTAEYMDTPVQAACRQCHINSSGFVVGHSTGQAVVVHAINTAGLIQDFGPCVVCHNGSTTAPAISPFHAKPTTRPNYGDRTFYKAPGRGSFNLFYNEFHRNPGKSNEGRSWSSGCGEDSNCSDRQWRSPAISYSMVTVSHLGTTSSVPTFSPGVAPPIPETGGSTPPPPPPATCTDPVGTLNAWTQIYSGTASSPSGSFTISTGTDRLLLVAVTNEYGSNTNNTWTVKYGGKALTQIAATNGGQANMWLGYLKEADIASRVGNTISVSMTGSKSYTRIHVASFAKVNQANPIGTSSSKNSGSTSVSSINLSQTLTIGEGSRMVYGATVGTSTSHSVSTGFTEAIESSGTSMSSSAGYRTVTTAGTANPTVSFGSYGRASIIGAEVTSACSASGGATSSGTTSGCRLNPGDKYYCQECGPCTAGVGDCDSTSDCVSGLTCRSDVGAQYGFSATTDVCAP